jgi:hypothetical protein
VRLLGNVGSDAKPGVRLIEAALREGGREERTEAAMALARIDPANTVALKYFTKLLGSTELNDNLPAIEGLSLMKAKAEDAIPVIMKTLGNRDVSLGCFIYVTLALRRYGPERVKVHAQGLSRLMTELLDWQEVRAAFLSGLLIQIEPSNGSARRIALKYLDTVKAPLTGRDWTDEAAEAAAETIGFLGPEARDAVPDLHKALKHRSRKVRAAAKQALEKCTRKMTRRIDMRPGITSAREGGQAEGGEEKRW